MVGLMRPGETRSRGRVWMVMLILAVFQLPLLSPVSYAQIGLYVTPPIPGGFDPEDDLRAPKPLRFYSSDSLAAYSHEGILFRIETEYDSTYGYYVSTRYMFNEPYGIPKAYTPEDYRKHRISRQIKKLLQEKFYNQIYRPSGTSEGGALEIQVPFKIKSKTFQGLENTC